MKKEIEQKERARWKGFIDTLQDESEWQPSFPRKEIWTNHNSRLWHYAPESKNGHIPVFLLYSHINKSSILDLTKEYSLIGTFLQEGYDVYLLEFGEPVVEEKGTGVAEYLAHYVDPCIKKALQHSGKDELSLSGFCLGGTLAVIYAALNPCLIRNLLLFVTPIDFGQVPAYHNWVQALKKDEIDLPGIMERIDLIPAPMIRYGMRALTSPIYYSPYLSLLNKAYDPDYAHYWRRFNQWTNDHISLTGAMGRDIITYFVKENVLMAGEFELAGVEVDLKKIDSNLYLISSQYDHLVPPSISTPLLGLVSSTNKVAAEVRGGHASLIKYGISNELKEWLNQYSQ
ncbi:alpha/beta fold hydrolase [Rossellomorea vietnamensis]|uniref:alpha/beta fold hydrolase n=1 Tax=Rossellomorea vietnamensis TaxID=218284 RepID=UPI001E546BCC|nr:alpha/beta fold hydrolase [Rossellomorea vietnamensis]MCC5802118.1 alpha/beta fold hydrolase [Rossellomorea vietnamensis]